MDAFSRIQPIAQQLLREVDAALATLGAPADHPVWLLLRRVGATPADAVAFFADAEPDQLRSAGAPVREQIVACAGAAIPAQVPWQGGAGEVYAARARAINEHLFGEHSDSMTARLDATASYVEDLAGWLDRSRTSLAAALADVITSTQAVTLAGGRTADGPSIRAVSAAADIGAYLLRAIAEAIDEGFELHRRWGPLLAELSIATPADVGPIRFDATIRLH